MVKGKRPSLYSKPGEVPANFLWNLCIESTA